MTHFDDIYEVAIDNYGLITTSEAKKLGVTRPELLRFEKAGWLERRGHGVYRISKYTPTPHDQYAEAVTLVGSGAYLHGESVLAMHDLALVNPVKTSVATTKRIRKKLPAWVQVVAAKSTDEVTNYEGISSQSVADAIRFCKGRVMQDRLADALNKAASAGLLTEKSKAGLQKELGL